MMPEELERLHKEILGFKSFELVTDLRTGVDRGRVTGTGAQAAAEETECLRLGAPPGGPRRGKLRRP